MAFNWVPEKPNRNGATVSDSTAINHIWECVFDGYWHAEKVRHERKMKEYPAWALADAFWEIVHEFEQGLGMCVRDEGTSEW